MHGGAHGSGGQPDNQNALKHGRYGTVATIRRRYLRMLVREARDLIDGLG